MLNSIQQKWVDALRSDKYKQGQRRLKNLDGTMCCLGCLTDLYIQEVGGEWQLELFGYSFDGACGVAPDRVQKWAGLKSYCGEYTPKLSLTLANDTGKSFEQIATIIEENADNLFRRPQDTEST